MRCISLYARFNNLRIVDDVVRCKLFNIYKLYSSSRKLWTEKNYNKLHQILDQWEENN